MHERLFKLAKEQEAKKKNKESESPEKQPVKKSHRGKPIYEALTQLH